jgi:hypothetical protein
MTSLNLWTNPATVLSFLCLSLKDRLGDQRGEWMGADKTSSRRLNSAYVPNSQPRIPTRVCQGRVVTTDLPTLGTNPKQSQRKIETQEGKNLAALRGTRQKVHSDRPNGPRGTGGRSAGHRWMAQKWKRTSRSAPRITDGPGEHCGQSKQRGPSGQNSSIGGRIRSLGVMIKLKDAQGNYPWSPPTNPNPNTSESKEQGAHENPTKIARKRHENHMSYKKEIDATMKASIHSEVRFFTNGGKI